MTPDSGSSKLHRNLGLLLLVGFCSMGVVNTYLLPPFQVPDERRHWLAAHHHLARLVTGEPTVCSTDVALVEHFKLGLEFQPDVKLPPGTFSRIAGLTKECQSKVMYPLSNLSSYPGVILSRVFVPREPESGQDALLGFYVSRLLHGCLITLMLWRLWRLAGASSTGTPGLLVLSLLTLSPIFIQQSFGVTNDVVTISFALALCSFTVFPDRQTRTSEALLLCLGLAAAFTKPVLSVPLLPAVALGFYLDRVRRHPGEPAPLVRSLVESLRARWRFVFALALISIAGVAFASTSLNPDNPRPAMQAAFILENPLHPVKLIASKFVTFIQHPRVFVQYVGYGGTPISAGTLALYWILAAIIGAVELTGLGARIRRLREHPESRPSLRRVYVPIAVVSLVAFGCVLASAFAIGFRSYLVASPIGGNRLFAMQARYLFPQLVVGLGLAMALARTFLADRATPPDRTHAPSGRIERFVSATTVALVAATLLAFAVDLATDLLDRYF